MKMYMEDLIMNVRKVAKEISKVLIITMLLLLTACQRKEVSKSNLVEEEEVINQTYTGVKEDNMQLSHSSLSVLESMNYNNILISYTDTLLLIENGFNRIELDQEGLRVHSNFDNVTLSKDGVLVDDSTSKVDISTDGIYVEDDGSKVEITQDGISINDGISGDNITIDFALADIIGSIVGEDFSMDNIMSNAFDGSSDWFNSMNMDNVYFLDYKTVINGKTLSKRIYLEDGYLITLNCDEDTTTVNGLFLDKVITDEEGNVYRYYSKENPVANKK